MKTLLIYIIILMEIVFSYAYEYPFRFTKADSLKFYLPPEAIDLNNNAIPDFVYQFRLKKQFLVIIDGVEIFVTDSIHNQNIVSFNSSNFKKNCIYSFSHDIFFPDPIELTDQQFTVAYPRMCLDSEGNIHIVFSKFYSKVWEVAYTKMDPLGRFLIDPFHFPSSSMGGRPFILCDKNDCLHILWRGGIWGDVRYMQMDKNANVILPEKIIWPGAASGFNYSVSAEFGQNNTIHLVWGGYVSPDSFPSVESNAFYMKIDFQGNVLIDPVKTNNTYNNDPSSGNFPVTPDISDNVYIFQNILKVPDILLITKINQYGEVVYEIDISDSVEVSSNGYYLTNCVYDSITDNVNLVYSIAVTLENTKDLFFKSLNTDGTYAIEQICLHGGPDCVLHSIIKPYDNKYFIYFYASLNTNLGIYYMLIDKSANIITPTHNIYATDSGPLSLGDVVTDNYKNLYLTFSSADGDYYKDLWYTANLSSCLPGDGNGDDLVNVIDIILAINYILENTVQIEQIANLDINKDLSIDISDIISIINIILWL